MIGYVLPLAAVVLANIAYQICAKSVPASLDPFASLTVTYLTAAAASFVIYCLFNRGENIIMEIHKLNPTPFIFGAVLVILEGGFIYAYKVGWQVSILTIVQSSFVAVGLIFVGWFMYKEPLAWNKLVGIGICLIGLMFINYK